MTTPNAVGEIALTIRDVKYILKPSVRWLLRIEETTDRGLVELIGAIAEGKLRFGHMAVIINHGIMAAGLSQREAPSVEDVAGWLMEDGNLQEATTPIVMFLKEALNAGPKKL